MFMLNICSLLLMFFLGVFLGYFLAKVSSLPSALFFCIFRLFVLLLRFLYFSFSFLLFFSVVFSQSLCHILLICPTLYLFASSSFSTLFNFEIAFALFNLFSPLPSCFCCCFPHFPLFHFHFPLLFYPPYLFFLGLVVSFVFNPFLRIVGGLFILSLLKSF